MTSYYSLLNKIEAFCDAHLQIKKFAGEFREQMPNFCTLDEKYPVVFVVPNASLPTLNQKDFTIDIYCVDVIQKDRANLNVILSDTELILNDIYLYFSDGPDLSVEILSSPTLTPLNNFDLDYVAGWFMTVTFQVNGYCVEAIPIESIEPGQGGCPSARIENSSGTYNSLIPSGDTLILPDVNIRVLDELGNVLSVADYPSVEDQTITVDCPDCIDGVAKIKKSGDGTIVNLNVPCGGVVEYDVADNQISVNGTFVTGIDATDPLDVLVKDENANTIVPSNITYLGNQHHLILEIDTTGFVPVGAQLLKTGQTISYASHDDGAIEAGRLNSFELLWKNNVFGNNKRFTDTLGLSLYANQWVIDWSTFADNKVLGYYINIGGGVTWAIAVSNSFGTFGGFGQCRLANIRELFNIATFGNASGCLNYAPFNVGAFYLASSTTQPDNAANAMYMYTAAQPIVNGLDKTAAAFRYIPVRDFTWNGTNLI